MLKKCEQCGAAFDAKRATAKYCSGRCRKAHHDGVEPGTRGIGLQDIFVPPSLPKEPRAGDIDSAIEAARTAAKAMDACGSLRDPRAPLCRLVAERIAAAFREVGL